MNFSVVSSIDWNPERALLQLNTVTGLPLGVTVLTGSPPDGTAMGFSVGLPVVGGGVGSLVGGAALI
jgi:hypothetical protein